MKIPPLPCATFGRSLALTGALAYAATALAQPSFTGHYPIGVEGLKSGTLPPPGFYLRDYNLFYGSSQLNDHKGNDTDVSFEAFAYANAIRPIWITDLKILGGYYGLDVLVPLIYKEVKVAGNRGDVFNLGDIFIEPITLSWHFQQFDLGIGYGIWAPTGEVKTDHVTGGTGQGAWAHMVTGGGTFYFDKEKTWALSALGRYEINYESGDWDITPGDTLSLEGGISKAISPVFELGVQAHYQVQLTGDEGHGGTVADPYKDSVVAVGPEIIWFWKSAKLFVSARYGYEVLAESRPQGHTATLTLTKMF
jgi:hypothetical protein